MTFIMDTAPLPSGSVRTVEIQDRWLAVANDQGTYHVFDPACPHEGGPLGRGEIHDGCIVCPVHHWPFDLNTGMTDTAMPWMRLQRYRCEVRDGKLYADLSHPILPDLDSLLGDR